MTLFCTLAWILISSDTVVLNLELEIYSCAILHIWTGFGQIWNLLGKFAVGFVKFIFWPNLSLLQIWINFVGLFLIYLKRSIWKSWSKFGRVKIVKNQILAQSGLKFDYISSLISSLLRTTRPEPCMTLGMHAVQISTSSPFLWARINTAFSFSVLFCPQTLQTTIFSVLICFPFLKIWAYFI